MFSKFTALTAVLVTLAALSGLKGVSADTHELHLPSENVYLAHRHMLRLSLFTHACACTITPVLCYCTLHHRLTLVAIVSSRRTHPAPSPHSLDSALRRFQTRVVDPMSPLRIALSLIRTLLLYLDVIRSFLFRSCISRFVTARSRPFRLN